MTTTSDLQCTHTGNYCRSNNRCNTRRKSKNPKAKTNGKNHI